EMRGVHSVAPRAQFHYHNPVKSRREIDEAYHAFGCRRLGGSSAHDFSSKFGATRPEAVELLKSIAALGFGPVLTFHPGSQCTDPMAYVRHITAAAKIARRAGVKLAALNVGGGFPTRYRD